MKLHKFILLLIFVGMIFIVNKFLTIENLQAHLGSFRQTFEDHPLLTKIFFFLGYVGTTTFAIPGATLLTLLAGYLFGLVQGTIIVSFASSLGALLCFWGARFYLGDYVRRHMSKYVEKLNSLFEQHGVLFILMLRLTPVIPFFVVNLVSGLTTVSSLTFYGISQIGMLPATILYVNAGKQLAQITSLSGLVSFPILFSLFLLGFFPFAMRIVFKKFKI